MLRGLLLVLLLANLAFLVWSQGGAGASGDHEPERLARQVHAEAVQLLTPEVAASAAVAQPSAASAGANPASAAEAASAPEAPASDAASSPVPAEASASAAVTAPAASSASAASPASVATTASAALVAAPALPPPAAGPPGTRCLEAGPFSGAELALAETALAASAKTRRIARRWVPITPDAASAPVAPQHRLRIDATPGEVAVLEALPASAVGRSFTPCTGR